MATRETQAEDLFVKWGVHTHTHTHSHRCGVVVYSKFGCVVLRFWEVRVVITRPKTANVARKPY